MESIREIEPIKMTALSLAMRYSGIKEIPGELNSAWVMAMLKLDNNWPTSDEVPWCFDGDVEIMTNNGFTPFNKLTTDTLVAQMNDDLKISLTRPLSLIKKRHKGSICRLSDRTFDLTCDPEHKFLGVWNKSKYQADKIELKSIKNLTKHLMIPMGSIGHHEKILDWSDHDIELFAAYLSDGFFHRGYLEFQVSKDRKIEALKKLNPLKIYKAKKAYGKSKLPLTTMTFDFPESFFDIFNGYKKPIFQLLWSMTKEQLKLFIKTFSIFDGSTRGNSHRLYSSSIYLIDWLQTAITLAGYHSSIRVSSISSYSNKPCYEVVYSTKKKSRTIRSKSISYENSEIDLYCVEVPSGKIIIRDHNKTVIPTGNCSAFTNFVCWQLRLPRTKSLMARSWLKVGQPVSIAAAQPGFDIVILARGSGNQPGPDNYDAPGHVGFFTGTETTTTEYGVEKLSGIHILGGNQGDEVCTKTYDAARLLGIRRLKID